MSASSSAAASSASGSAAPSSGSASSSASSASSSSSMTDTLYHCANCSKLIAEDVRHDCVTCSKHDKNVSFCHGCFVKKRLDVHKAHDLEEKPIKPARAPTVQFQCSACAAKFAETKSEEIHSCLTCAEFNLCHECNKRRLAFAKAAKSSKSTSKGAKAAAAAAGPATTTSATTAAKSTLAPSTANAAAIVKAHAVEHKFGEFSCDELPESFHVIQRTIAKHYENAFRRRDSPYVRARINGQIIDALVDTGAELTIITVAAALKCGMKQFDTTFAGQASGVGVATIHGLVHDVAVELGEDFDFEVDWAFHMLQDAATECILGMDFLRAHDAVIDTSANEMVLEGEHTIPFLERHERLMT